MTAAEREALAAQLRAAADALTKPQAPTHTPLSVTDISDHAILARVLAKRAH